MLQHALVAHPEIWSTVVARAPYDVNVVARWTDGRFESDLTLDQIYVRWCHNWWEPWRQRLLMVLRT